MLWDCCGITDSSLYILTHNRKLGINFTGANCACACAYVRVSSAVGLTHTHTHALTHTSTYLYVRPAQHTRVCECVFINKHGAVYGDNVCFVSSHPARFQNGGPVGGEGRGGRFKVLAPLNTRAS